MRKTFKNIIQASLTLLIALGTTGCLEEAFPEDNQQTADQIKNADKAALVSAIPAYLNSYNDDDPADAGFAAFGVWRDAMTADFPIYDTGYDYFVIYNMQLYLGDYSTQTLFWRRYYYLLQKANSVISICEPTSGGQDASYLGTALTYRAWVYMDLMRMYEYRSTGVARLDEFAETNGLYGLTVPLITEKTTEAEARNLPRAPFTQLYRFIMNDLNLAEKMLEDTPVASAKNMVCRGVVYGMKARLWLDMGSRFLNHADELSQQIDAENNPDYEALDKLAINNANDCFANAATYARKAISEGFKPLTAAEWYDPKNGFNSPNDSWMWCIIITSDNGIAKNLTYQSMASYLSPETNYGIATSVYGGYRMIDARLYGEMNPNDWRKDTWIAPTDAGKESAFNARYAKTTSMTYDEWRDYAPYTGFKFHPGQGNRDTYAVGNAISTPLMRVEEMYLIEAEAVAHSQGAGAGKQLLESFMNSFRMTPGTTFTCKGFALEEVVDEIFRQKRIELWGEGLILWDYRRLEKAIERGYDGTNHPAAYRFNSYPNKVAPWTTFYIPDRVNQLNPACKLNPDPSDAIPAWEK